MSETRDGRPYTDDEIQVARAFASDAVPAPVGAPLEGLVAKLRKVASDLDRSLLRQQAFQKCEGDGCQMVRSSSGHYCADCQRSVIAEAIAALAVPAAASASEGAEPSDAAIGAALHAYTRFGVALSDSGLISKVEAVVRAAYAVDFPAAARVPQEGGDNG